MTHRALELWHELMDPMMGVKPVSFSGLPQRVIACSFSDQKGRCQNYKTAFKWLPGNVHSVILCAFRVQAVVPKHYHRDLRNVMMSVVDVDISRLQSGTPKVVVLINYAVGRIVGMTWQTFFCFWHVLVLSLQSLLNYWRNQRSWRSLKLVELNFVFL